MNRVASIAAVVALLAIGFYFYQSQPVTDQGSINNAKPASLTAQDGSAASCCSEKSCCSEQVAAAGSCCSESGIQTVATGSCCSEGGTCANEGKTEVAATCPHCTAKTQEVATSGEAKSCPCSGGKTETVATGEQKECTGECDSNCCQEKSADQTSEVKTGDNQQGDK